MLKDAPFGKMKEFFVGRMRSVFPAVADAPLILRNSRQSPLDLLAFAAANPRGAATAVKIARDILQES